MVIQLTIENGTRVYEPVVKGDIRLITERRGVPGKLTFSVMEDEALAVEEGSAVRLTVDGEALFYGFVFTIQRDKNPYMEITAYDQLRYLKSKDTYVFEEATASDVIAMIAGDYGLTLGEIEATGYRIPSRIEENSTLLDMMLSAIDMTLTNTGKLYILYDKAGKLTLTAAEKMTVGLVIDAQTGESVSLSSTIDEQTYNRIKLVYKDGDSGKYEVFTAQDKAGTMQKWGTLQYFETINGKENAQHKADTLLSLYNTKTKKLSITALGDARVRAGCYVVIRLTMGETKIENFMMVEKCDHQFKDGVHRMTLTLRGGGFVA